MTCLGLPGRAAIGPEPFYALIDGL